MKTVMPGGSGQVGRMLARHFLPQGHEVTVFSRSPQPAPWRVVFWDGLTAGDWISDLAQSDICINLAGRSVNCRYSAVNRRSIYDSRILSTRLLNDANRLQQACPATLDKRQHRHHLPARFGSCHE